MYVHVKARGRSEWVSFSSLDTLVFETGSLTNLSYRQARLAGKQTPGILRFCLSNVRVTGVSYHILLLQGCWGTELGSSRLCTSTLLTAPAPWPTVHILCPLFERPTIISGLYFGFSSSGVFVYSSQDGMGMGPKSKPEIHSRFICTLDT